MTSQFFGKYRGKVRSNRDPDGLGRLEVIVPAVLDQEPSWAMPCVPYAGNGVGFFALPPQDANIWVEFEGGDPDHPIWTGCFWGRDEVPADPAEESMKVFKTEAITVTLKDGSGGGFTLEVGSPIVQTPLTLVFSSSGIEIKNGSMSIKLEQAKVSVNDGALEVV